MKLFSIAHMSLFVAATALFACAESGEQNSNLEANAIEESSGPAKDAMRVMQTGKPVFSVSLIQHGDQHQSMAVAAAHGADGVSIYDLYGNLIWRDLEDAKLVAYYQSNLVVYRDHTGQSALDRYKVDALHDPVKITTQSPSPIAATTLQRTAYSALGPLRISGEQIDLPENQIDLGAPVAAVAATGVAVEDFPDGIVAIAMMDGEIRLYSLSALQNANI